MNNQVETVVRRFERRDWLAAALFFGVATLGYAVTRTRLAYLWDSVEFALAITDYNITLSQPHAPGYFLYVMLGRLVNVFVGDPQASLVWMSVVGGAGLVGVMYLLGTAMIGRATGVAAGLLTLASPMVWFYSSVALTYVVDALLVVSLVLLCWRAREREVPWGFVLVIAGLLGVIGGVRQQSVPGMLVLVGLTLGRAREGRVQKVAAAIVVWGAVTSCWVGWMLATIGGWETYWHSLHSIGLFHVRKTLAGGGWGAAAWNVFFAGLYSFNGLLLGVVALLGALVQSRGKYPEAIRVILWWILPVFLLATMVGYTEAPGHVFTYLPALILLAAVFVGDRRRLLAAIVVVNLLAFWVWPAQWDGVLWGTLRTRRELQEHDQQLCNSAQVVREHFRPDETILCHWNGDLLFGMRHFQFCLPEFANIRLDPDLAMVKPPGRELMMVKGGKTDFVSQIDLSRYRQVVFVVPAHLAGSQLAKLGELKDRAKRFALGKVDLYVVPGTDLLLRQFGLDQQPKPE